METLYLPAEARRDVLRDYAERYGCDYFVETGTANGDTPAALVDTFTHLYTIELDRVTFERARRRFRREPKVTCLRGDSGDLLPDVLGRFDGRALCWVDGHVCSPGGVGGEYGTSPIRRELDVLIEDDRRHVILIDDVRCFDGQPEHESADHLASWPTIEYVQERLLLAGYVVEIADDILRAVPKELAGA